MTTQEIDLLTREEVRDRLKRFVSDGATADRQALHDRKAKLLAELADVNYEIQVSPFQREIDHLKAEKMNLREQISDK